MKKKIRREPPKTCAIYARCACKSEESIRKQIEVCKAEARNHGWAVADEHVYRDDGRSGFSDRRPGLNALLELAQDKAHPFETVIVDAEYRLNRNIAQYLSIRNRLARSSVRIHILGVDDSKYMEIEAALLAMSHQSVTKRR